MAASAEGLIVVMPHARVRALGDIANPSGRSDGDEGEETAPGGGPLPLSAPFGAVPWREAFERDWPTDAHVQLVAVEPHDPAEPVFRLRKGIIPSVIEAGGSVLLRWIGVEWDTGKGDEHVPWTREAWDSFADRLAEAKVASAAFASLLARVAAEYATRKGYRWFFRLEPPVDAPLGEAVARGVRAIFLAAGIDVDEKCADWTRLFRLPSVIRDGTATRGDPFWFPPILSDVALDPREIEPVGVAARATKRIDEEQPEPEAALALVEEYDEAKNSWRKTPFGKEAHESLKGHDCFDAIFGMEMPEIPEGERHDTIKGWIAQAANYLPTESTAAQVFGLFVRVAQQLEDESDDERRNFLDETWRLVVDLWGKELASREEKEKEKQEKKRQEETRQIETGADVFAGVRSWHPALPLDPPKALEWIKRRAVAVTRTGDHYVLGRNGRYSLSPVRFKSQLIPQVIQQGMGGIIAIKKKMDDSDRERFARYDEIINDQSVNVAEVVARAQVEGGYFENPEEEHPKLVVSLFRRNPKLEPKYDERVDEWLFHFAGKNAKGASLHERLNRQIGLFMAFEKGAVCLMSFKCAPGAGKKLLAHGFMETLERPHLATGRDLVNDFNGGLLRSPFVNANEGLPSSEIGSAHVADVVRMLVTADVFYVNEKNIPALTIRFPYRLILTANNRGILLALSQNRDLEPHDRDALAQRIQHYEPGDAPTKFLQSRGDEKFTRGWIAGDGNSPSQFVVARHFLWLFEQHGRNAEPIDKHGLLMAGDPESSPIDFMRAQGGSTPSVIEIVVKMLNSPGVLTDGSLGILVHEGKIYVIPGPLLDYWRRNLTDGAAERLTARKVSNSLKGLTRAGGLNGEKSVRVGGVVQRWHEIDVPLVFHEAHKLGWDCPKLEHLHKAQGGLTAAEIADGAGQNGTHSTSGRLLIPGGTT